MRLIFHLSEPGSRMAYAVSHMPVFIRRDASSRETITSKLCRQIFYLRLLIRGVRLGFQLVLLANSSCVTLPTASRLIFPHQHTHVSLLKPLCLLFVLITRRCHFRPREPTKPHQHSSGVSDRGRERTELMPWTLVSFAVVLSRLRLGNNLCVY